MIDHAGAYHIQINVHETAMQVLVRCDSRSVTMVFLECAMSILALNCIVFLRRPAGDQLHALGLIPASVP